MENHWLTLFILVSIRLALAQTGISDVTSPAEPPKITEKELLDVTTSSEESVQKASPPINLFKAPSSIKTVQRGKGPESSSEYALPWNSVEISSTQAPTTFEEPSTFEQVQQHRPFSHQQQYRPHFQQQQYQQNIQQQYQPSIQQQQHVQQQQQIQQQQQQVQQQQQIQQQQSVQEQQQNDPSIQTPQREPVVQQQQQHQESVQQQQQQQFEQTLQKHEQSVQQQQHQVEPSLQQQHQHQVEPSIQQEQPHQYEPSLQQQQQQQFEPSVQQQQQHQVEPSIHQQQQQTFEPSVQQQQQHLEPSIQQQQQFEPSIQQQQQHQVEPSIQQQQQVEASVQQRLQYQQRPQLQQTVQAQQLQQYVQQQQQIQQTVQPPQQHRVQQTTLQQQQIQQTVQQQRLQQRIPQQQHQQSIQEQQRLQQEQANIKQFKATSVKTATESTSKIPETSNEVDPKVKTTPFQSSMSEEERIQKADQALDQFFSDVLTNLSVKMKTGMDEPLGEILDPVRLDDMQLQPLVAGEVFDVKMKRITVGGLSEYKVTQLESQLSESRIKVGIHYPKLHANCLFAANGTMYEIFKVTGRGNATIIFNEVHARTVIYLTKEDGVLQVTSADQPYVDFSSAEILFRDEDAGEHVEPVKAESVATQLGPLYFWVLTANAVDKIDYPLAMYFNKALREFPLNEFLQGHVFRQRHLRIHVPHNPIPYAYVSPDLAD